MHKTPSPTRLILIIILFLVNPIISLANATSEILSIEYTGFEAPLEFNVTLPNSYKSKTSKLYVLLFDFHPRSHAMLSGLQDWLSHNGEWPWLETIIVTPAYGNTVGKLFDVKGDKTPLLDFFETAMLPAIDQKYRTNGFKIISGFRQNGSIVLSALLNKPDMFDAHIAISPELKNNFAGILSTAKAKLAAMDDAPRFLLFAHGNNVKEEYQIDKYQTLLSLFSKAPTKNLDFHYEDLSHHYFMSLPALAMISGVEKLFDDINAGIPPTSEIASKGVTAIVKHYAWLSREKYGFEVSPKFSIRNLAYHLLKTDSENGIETFKELVNLYPKDAYSFHYLADAYAHTGNYNEALKHQKIAVEMSGSMLTWHQKNLRKSLVKYQTKVAELN